VGGSCSFSFFTPGLGVGVGAGCCAQTLAESNMNARMNRRTDFSLPAASSFLSLCLGRLRFLCGFLAVLVEQRRNLFYVLAGLPLRMQSVDVDVGALFGRNDQMFSMVEVQQLRADQARDRPIRVVGRFFVKLNDVDCRSVFDRHNSAFHCLWEKYAI